MTTQRAVAAAIVVFAATVIGARAAGRIRRPDGSLLIPDDQGGRILRVSYGK